MRHDSAFGDNSKDGKAREFSERSWHSSGGTSSPFRLVGSLQLYSPPAMGGVWNSRCMRRISQRGASSLGLGASALHGFRRRGKSSRPRRAPAHGPESEA